MNCSVVLSHHCDHEATKWMALSKADAGLESIHIIEQPC
uniref:Bm537 n=1 Tax=Brugia malayi TaxID=6279 RepID=A0A0J9XWS1_BRUMA|nr:Bm537 [Brugia malayi]